LRSLDKAPVGEREREAIEAAARILKEKFAVENVILFGSQARGEADAYSDIDLLLISGRELHWKEEKKIVDALFEIGMEHDVIFSLLFTSSEEWEKGIFRAFPIYEEIKAEGALVA
jgi:uncharacterized protein